jgi:hypothetical protein
LFCLPRISYQSKVYQFEAFSNECAILVLPEGGTRTNLLELKVDDFREYAIQNAASWYRHAKIVNGSLYLITGRDSAMSYGAVTFSDVPLPPGDFISAKFILDKGADNSERKNWSCRWDSLNWSPITHRGKISENGSDNLCVFIRGFKITLDEASYQQSFDNGSFPPTPTIPNSGLLTGHSTSQSAPSDFMPSDDSSRGGSGRGGRSLRSSFRRLWTYHWRRPSPRRPPAAPSSSHAVQVHLGPLPGQSQVRHVPTSLTWVLNQL